MYIQVAQHVKVAPRSYQVVNTTKMSPSHIARQSWIFFILCILEMIFCDTIIFLNMIKLSFINCNSPALLSSFRPIEFQLVNHGSKTNVPATACGTSSVPSPPLYSEVHLQPKLQPSMTVPFQPHVPGSSTSLEWPNLQESAW